jgi:hypothetical protein
MGIFSARWSYRPSLKFPEPAPCGLFAFSARVTHRANLGRDRNDCLTGGVRFGAAYLFHPEPVMSETSAEIFAQSLPMVSNPPRSTTRTPDEVEADIVAQKDMLHRYTAAMKAEGTWPPLDAKPLDSLHYVLSNFIYEHAYAYRNAN